MANKKNAFFNSTNGWTGVQPGMKYEYFPPVGSGRVVEWENQGWDRADAKAALDDIYQTWEQITEHYGRQSQKNLYAESDAG